MNKKVRIAVAVAAVVLVALGVWFARFRDTGGTVRASATLATVERKDLEIAVEAAGVIEPIRVVEVKSKASGEVLRVEVETGAVVKKDALLAEIDPRDVQNALAQAEADVESARVRLSTTSANRQRMETLRGSGVVTQQELEAAVEGEATAKATAVRAETNLQLARERRRDVIIRAPIDGTVIERSVEPGGIIASATSNVSGGTTLFRMADLSEMQVRAKVDEIDVGQIQPGQPAKVTVEAYAGRSFQGTVLKIEPQAVVEQNVTMFPVLVRLDNQQGLLRPGMNAEVSVEVATRESVPVVPNSAIVSMREARSVASVLGIDEEAMRSALRGGAGGPPEGRPGAVAEVKPGVTSDAAPEATPAASPGPGAAAKPDCAALWTKMRESSRESLTDADRDALRACREAREASGGVARDGADADGGFMGGHVPRPGVVFVQTATGPQPRRVTLGLSDWEVTEVVSGLDAGEQVVLVSVAQIKRQQQELQDRIRQRTSGGLRSRPSGGGH